MKAYLKVYHAIRQQIQSGEVPVGSMLPPEPMLEKQFSVSRTTVRRAMLRLSEEGFIRIQQGRGTEVLSPLSSDDTFHNASSIQEILSSFDRPFAVHSCCIDRIYADRTIAGALQIPEGTSVYQIQRLLYHDSSPFALMKNYVRTDLAPNLEQYAGDLIDLYELLRKKYHLVFFYSKEHLSAVAAGFMEANLLNVRPGTPLLFCTRYAQTQTVPLEYGQIYFRTDQYALVVERQG
ncbi:MAG: GntR family transcriptional regulator [Lachnospiraceae bacterium]|nr:GntR family transcriptional regulator [Lachnospiraceae bacterium]